LFIGICITPNISGNIKTINKVVNEDVTNDRIEDMHGYKYDDRGHFFKNPLVKNNTNLVNIYNNGPGRINPIWISLKEFGYYSSMKAYKDYIYVVGYVYYPEDKNFSALLAKFDISDGEFLWMKTWEGFHPGTRAYSLEIYNDSIYTIGHTGPPGSSLYYMDSFICKYDLDGNLLWSRLINESNWDYFWDVKQYDNHLYICGDIEVTLGQDAWILKYDMNGDKIWGKTYKIQGTWLNRLYALEIYDDYIYIEGQTDSSDSTNQDVLVVKFSLDGDFIWNREWGGTGPQLGAGMDVEDGYIYVCGFGRSAGVIESPSYGILLKYDTEGEIQWEFTTSTESLLGFVKIFNESIYTTGKIWGLYPYYPKWDVLLQKHDDIDGKLIWYLTYGEDYGNDAGRCIETYNNSFYLCGYMDIWDYILNYDVDYFSENNKPEIPSIPSGPTNGIIGVEYDYYSNTTDSDGDLLSYCFSWGDENVTLTNWINSGETVTASYSWSRKGIYNIRVRARDECGFISEWSDPLVVTMPRDKAITSSLFYWFLERYPLLNRLLSFTRMI
jgi:hypothetical protein